MTPTEKARKGEPAYETHLFEYDFDGVTWTLEFKAKDRPEAVRRVAAFMSNGRYLGGPAHIVKLPKFFLPMVLKVLKLLGWRVKP